MENNQPITPAVTPEVKRRRFGRKTVLILVIVLALIGFGGWYVWQSQDQKDNNSASGWAEYKSDKSGLKFQYPKDWGLPQVTEKAEKKGKTYSIAFITPKESAVKNRSISITMETDDLERQVCPAGQECPTMPGFTKNEVNQILKLDKTDFTKYDSSSYAFVKGSSEGKLISGLDYAQVVNLPTLNISAAQAIYHIFGDKTGCPSNKLSAVNDKGCVTESDYENLRKTVNSISIL